MPRISVVVPAYNAGKYVAESVRSITAQTFSDFELILVDDGSTDATPPIVNSIDDHRIRYFRLDRNSGTATAVNLGYDRASGEFIAHLDADDIAMPDRFERQMRFMAEHPHITVVGSTMDLFGGRSGRADVYFDDPKIKASFLPGFGNVLNPTAMFRRDFIELNKLRCDPALKGGFDWGFWVDVMWKGGRFVNLPDPLVRYRVHGGQQSRDQLDIQAELATIRCRILDLFFPQLSDSERTLMEPLAKWLDPPNLEYWAVKSGLDVLERAISYRKQSFAGEDRTVLASFLTACRDRWQSAMKRHQSPQQMA